MKERNTFWLLSSVFVLICVGILLFSHLNTEREALVYTDLNVTSQTCISELQPKNHAGNGKININTASAEELTSLSGIGEKTAAAIIAYREENGDFNSIDEIMEVSGIGEGKFKSIEDHITI